MSHSPQDEGYTSCGAQPSFRTSGKRSGAADQRGTDYEILMCVLLFLRAVQTKRSFQLSTNQDWAGNFDDIVLSFVDHQYLIQLKQSKSRGKHLHVKDYFESLYSSNTYQYRDCSFIYYTNANVYLEPSVPVVDSDVKTLLATGGEIKDHKDIFQLKLSDNVCLCLKDKDRGEDFVKRLYIFRNQADVKHLDEMIKQELLKISNGVIQDNKNMQRTLVEKVKAWWGKRGKADPLDENWSEWLNLRSELPLENTLLTQIRFSDQVLADLKKRVKASSSPIILIRSGLTDLELTCIKIHQIFSSEVRTFFTSTSNFVDDRTYDLLSSLWKKYVYDLLVVVDATDCGRHLGENITSCEFLESNCDSLRKLVIVSNSDIESFGLNPTLVEEIPFEEFTESTFGELDDRSKTILKNATVHFQGKKVRIDDLEAAEKVLKGNILQFVLTASEIMIGKPLTACSEKYIPRTLSMRIAVRKCALALNDKFYIGVESCDLRSLLAEAKQTESLDERWFKENEHRYVILNPKELSSCTKHLKCCDRRFTEVSSHFLEMVDDSLCWVHSHGNIDALLLETEHYARQEDDLGKLMRDLKSCRVREEDLVDQDFQTVVVADEPGSGKTFLLQYVAFKLKEKYPNRWVLYVDLNKQSAFLTGLQTSDRVTLDDVLRLLIYVAGVESCDLGKLLLTHHLTQADPPNVCILFDAFDEIRPKFTDTVLQILELISKSLKVSTLWVTSRHNVKEQLESTLESKVFRVEPFSAEEEFNVYTKLWGMDKAKKFRRKVKDKMPSRDGVRLSSFPLHLEMICEVCHDLVAENKYSEIARKLDVYNLYEDFIGRKLDIYFKDKASLNKNPSPTVDNLMELGRTQIMTNHMICSLVLLDILDELKKITKSSLKKKYEIICRDIADGKELTGIIDGIVDGKPHFIHRTFAEYFAGKWLADNLEETDHYIKKIVFDPQSEVVYKVFCHALVRDKPFHLAVLNEDVDKLKQMPRDIKDVDDLGRTPVHLASQSRDKGLRKVLKALLERGPDLEVYDDLLGLKPVYYAARARAWTQVRALLIAGARVEKDVAHLPGVEQLVASVCTSRNDYSEFLKTGFEPSWAIFNERNVFHLAVKEGDLPLLKQLLDVGVDLEMRDFYGDTALCIAITCRDVDVVRLLLESGARCQDINKNGDSATVVARNYQFERPRVYELIVAWDEQHLTISGGSY